MRAEFKRRHGAIEAIAPRDFRDICTCQAHARREATLWRRSLSTVRNASVRAKRSGLAVLIGVPVAFGALGFPMEAMNLALPSFTRHVHLATQERDLPVFTERARRDFLQPALRTEAFTLEVAKEEFFRTQVPYGSIIYREARRNNLSPELIAAVVEAESDFRPRLVSNKQAQGLMQLVPETGRLMGADNLFNPSENIAAGTKYLRYLFDRFGDEKVVLAAYNAGEGNVERFGGVPPFSETHDYVQRVASHTSRYSRRVRGKYLASLQLRRTVMQ